MPGTVGGGDCAAGGGPPISAGCSGEPLGSQKPCCAASGHGSGRHGGNVGVVNRCRPDRREPDNPVALFQRLRREGRGAAVRRWARRRGNWRAGCRRRAAAGTSEARKARGAGLGSGPRGGWRGPGRYISRPRLTASMAALMDIPPRIRPARVGYARWPDVAVARLNGPGSCIKKIPPCAR